MGTDLCLSLEWMSGPGSRCLGWGCFKTHFQLSMCGMGVDMEEGAQSLPSN